MKSNELIVVAVAVISLIGVTSALAYANSYTSKEYRINGNPYNDLNPFGMMGGSTGGMMGGYMMDRNFQTNNSSQLLGMPCIEVESDNINLTSTSDVGVLI